MGAVVEVDHLGGQSGGLRDLLGGGDGMVVEVVGGLCLRLEELLQHGRPCLREVLAGRDAVEGRQIQLRAVVQGRRLALVGQQARPGDELRQRVRAAGGEGRGAHRGLLVELLDVLARVDAGALQGPYQRAVGGRADARGHLPALEVLQGGEPGAGRGDDGVQAAAQVVAGDRHQAGGAAQLLAPGGVDEQGEVAHRPDVDLSGGHLGRDGGTGGVVLPDDLVGDAVAARVQPLLEVAEGAEQSAGRDRVDGLGLVADGDGDRGVVPGPGLTAAGGEREQKGERGRGDCRAFHGGGAFHRSR